MIAPRSCHDALVRAGIPAGSVVRVEPGAEHDCEKFSVRIVYAYHGETEVCGFLLKTKYGNIYFPGDCGFNHPYTYEMCNLEVGYLLLPINDTNMGVGFAALLTHLLQPEVVIPCHYGYVYPAVRFQGGGTPPSSLRRSRRGITRSRARTSSF